MNITIEQKQNLESEFLKKYPDDVLKSWDIGHYDIVKFINEKNLKVGLEIGVAYGGHCEAILENSEVEKIYGIDPYKNYKEYEGDLQNFSQDKQDDLFNFVRMRLSYYKERFELIRSFSDDCFDRFENESLDFIYIDGNHFENFISNDLENWFSKVKKGGFMSGHDYNHPSFPHVTKAVDNFFKNLDMRVEYLGNHNWITFK